MHEGEVEIDTALVTRLVAAQFPALADRPVQAVRSTGTVNAIYRLGDDLYARLPRVAKWAADLEREWEWLPRLAPLLPLAVPTPVWQGRAGDAYPFSWAIYAWIDGDPYAEALVDDPCAVADALADFVAALRRIEPVSGAPRGGRRPLRELDAMTRDAIAAAARDVDATAATAAWERALEAPVWDGTPVWIHGDLLPPNLLVRDGGLAAAIDFGGAGVGDPATDVIPAWSVFGPAARTRYRAGLKVGDGTWERARGIALHQAAMIVPYYRESNSAFTAMAVRTIQQLLSD
ncbi:aminoglycoside phosphotransferase family protein [Solirubrobacter ginsenosidimutans]|uniref:Aminoglycoside phosphotransferase family protein n=1 Tax=Solirubrobacter ginsenosidimutans TaxID=490573 RepID=A0A9X3MV67_9ACTN|nr:aminoglycoside phosphotransferase family protein [Solirubrobacter ginsenosidimutans]MDA0162987.1 aminoglycoside phosphotransferase family protein [Solirubrobacter ginsenosidimutans]